MCLRFPPSPCSQPPVECIMKTSGIDIMQERIQFCHLPGVPDVDTEVVIDNASQ